MSNSPPNKSNNSPTHSVNFTITAAQGINTSPSPPRCHVYIISCTVPGSQSPGSTFLRGQRRLSAALIFSSIWLLANTTPPHHHHPPPNSPNLCVMIGLPPSAPSPRPSGCKIKKETSLSAMTLSVFMSFLVVYVRKRKRRRKRTKSSSNGSRNSNIPRV